LDRLVDDVDRRAIARLAVEELDVLGKQAHAAVARVLADAGGGVRPVEAVARGGELDPVLAERVVGAGLDLAYDVLALRPHLRLDRRRDVPDRMLPPSVDAVVPVGCGSFVADHSGRYFGWQRSFL